MENQTPWNLFANLQSDTARVIWSFSTSDPSDSLGVTALRHNFEGAVSVNLLSGITAPPADPANFQYFDVAVTNVRKQAIVFFHWWH